MTNARTFAAVTLFFAALGVAGCGRGVEGTYKLDKAEVKKAMEGELAKMPADQQPFGKLALGMVDKMDITVELRPGGKLKMTTTVPALEPGKPAKTDSRDGTWKVDGDNVVLEADGKPTKCTKSGPRLNCASDKQGEPPMVFVKS
jgi:hypothetical protein